MITPQEIGKQAASWYKSFLIAWLQGETLPLEIRFGKVKTGGILDDFATLHQEIKQLRKASKEELGYGYSIEFKETDTRKAGRQGLPNRIFFESDEEYLKYLRKEKEFRLFAKAVSLIRMELPQLEPWMSLHPLKVLDNAVLWEDLLQVCRYFLANPKPNQYIRELPIPVHTKFMEENTAVLTSLLDFLLPEYYLPEEKDFRKRYHLKYDEPLLRLRILDDELALRHFSGLSDLSIPLSQFQGLHFACERVFILENKTNFSNIFNFLTLPHLKGSVAIFGEGYKLRLLKNTAWLQAAPLFYWGDIDGHGFEMLSILRGYFPQTRSFLMDMPTFRQFKPYAVKGPEFLRSSLPYLTDEESQLFRHLLHSEGPNRLEQEKIPHAFVLEKLSRELGNRR